MSEVNGNNLIVEIVEETSLCGIDRRDNFRFFPGVEFKFDLQLFADDSPTGQRTEEATQHRRELARKEGNVAKSMDLTGMVTLLCAFTSVYYFSGYIIAQTRLYFISQYSGMGARFDELFINASIIQFMTVFFVSVVPVFLCSVAGAIAICYYQVGFEYTLEPLMFNVGHMNPINGISKMISWQPVFELFKAFAKVALVAYLPYSFFKANLIQFPKFLGMEVEQIVASAGPLIFDLGLKVLIAMLLMAVVDYYYQHTRYERSIMMSKYDLQQEYKQMEGNPLLKQELRRRARKIATGQMLKQVPKAKVVITNPTHFAVALAYEKDTGGAPVVVAKGTDFIAQKIKEIARENNIVIVEDKPLARGLYAGVEIGEQIPDEFFNAVAQALAFVYKQQKKY